MPKQFEALCVSGQWAVGSGQYNTGRGGPNQ
jgi:hypothetical protein